MNFSSKGQDTNSTPKMLELGVQNAKVLAVVVRTSSTNKKSLELTLSGPDLENFEGFPINKDEKDGAKYKSQVAFVQASSWLKEDDYNSSDIKKNEIMNKMIEIAKQVGIKDKVDAIDASTLEEWVEKVHEMIQHEYLYFFIAGQEDMYNDKIRTKRVLPKYKFCSNTPDGLDKFDPNNQYHLRKYKTEAAAPGFEPAGPAEDFQFPVS